MIERDPTPSSELHSRMPTFHDLMRRRVHHILVVSSLYDSFLIAQDGQLEEQMISEFMELKLSQPPHLTRVSTTSEALDLMKTDPSYDLVVATPRSGGMSLPQFVRELRAIRGDVPIVVLAFDDRELVELRRPGTDEHLPAKVFLWQGDFRILLAIVKSLEDHWNVEQDTRAMGVQSIILVEDNVRFYSSYLPMFYAEVMQQSQNLISEGVNLYHKLLRMRARPKVLHCESFEEAWECYRAHEPFVLGIVSDIEFPQNGKLSPEAGAQFTRRVLERRGDIPILLQSSEAETAELAQALGVSFVRKDSPTLLHELRQFMTDNFGFGDFVFRLPDRREIDRASDMRSLEWKLHTIPAESIRYHAERNHFSNWLKARTEFELAERLKPRKVSDYPTLEALRQDVIESLRSYRVEQSRGTVVDFRPEAYDAAIGMVRVGGGSLGGKARGLAFMNRLLRDHPLEAEFNDVKVAVPPGLVLCTELFDRFLTENGLREFALQGDDDLDIERRFVAARLPDDVRQDLAAFLDVARFPLAVRSSSLLEDSQFHPFAGVYRTYMLANNYRRARDRLQQLESAVKRIYASTFTRRARLYLANTTYRLEEEKMAVIVQKLVGTHHEARFYPDISGVARSHNYYPVHPMQSSDGVVSVALGLGKTVVEGNNALRFCPKYPRHIIGLSSPHDYLENSQRTFYALDLTPFLDDSEPTRIPELIQCDLPTAENDGVLQWVGAVYSPETDAIHDGLSRSGARVINFAPILKHQLFPLPRVVARMLELARSGLGGPVEIEFAITLANPPATLSEFNVLQMRPLVISRETEDLRIEDFPVEDLLCQSEQVLGVGRIDGIRDVVVVDRERFERAHSHQVAEEVGRFNAKLQSEDSPYLLIGVGRWGSADPWLGIPVTWEQIAGARVIVEAGFKDLTVTPSQGAHFFQNLTALRIGYFTLNPDRGDGFLDWEWLRHQPAVRETTYVRHLCLKNPISIRMNAHEHRGVILKPAESA